MGTKNKTKAGHEDVKLIIGIIKKVLRERGISYKELAVKMNMSESGLKKVFSSSDCSYQRMTKILDILGLRLIDILQEIESEELRPSKFSDAQQAYFLKNIDVFNFYVKLVVERHSLEELQSYFKLTEAQQFKILKQLDQLRLLQLLPGSTVKLPPIALVKNFGAGPLLEKIYQDWTIQTAKELAHPKFQASGQFIIRSFQMKNETYQELLQKLLELEREFLTRAVREMNVSTSKLRNVRFAWLTDQSSFVKSGKAL